MKVCLHDAVFHRACQGRGKVPLCLCKCRRLPLQNFKLPLHVAILPLCVTLPQSHAVIAAHLCRKRNKLLPTTVIGSHANGIQQ
jgi:hypothetical protein